MANQSCNNKNNNGNSNECSSIIATTATVPGSPWKKISEPQNVQVQMDSVIDDSTWPALSSKRVPSPEVTIPESSSPSAGTETAASEDNADESSAIADSMVSASVSLTVPIDCPAPGSAHDKLVSPTPSTTPSSTSSSRGTHSNTVQNRSARHYSYGHNQNHQHYSSGRSGSNQRGNGFNGKGGNRGGDGFPNQNFSNRRNQQRGFNNWNHNRGAHGRLANTQQNNPHGFGNGPSGFLGPPPPLPHSFPHSTPMVNPSYINVNVNLPPPPPPPPVPAPIPGFILPFGYYGNHYFSDAYYPSVHSLALSSPPPPPPPPYMDARSGAPTNDQPLLPKPEVELCNSILHQIEYYFSKENLVKDVYLKSLMDKEGWVPVHVIAGFNRVKAITSNSSLIVKALEHSSVVEVQGDKVRKRGDWMNWIQHYSPAARISSVADISTSFQNIQLGESAGADALVG